MNNEQQIEVLAGKALMGEGVCIAKIRAPLLLRLLGRKHIKLYFKYPTLRELVAFSGHVSKMGLPDDELQAISLTSTHALTFDHAEQAMVALVGVMGIKIPILSTSQIVRYVLCRISAETFDSAWLFYLNHGGARDFTITIMSMATAKIMSPMSQRSQTAE